MHERHRRSSGVHRAALHRLGARTPGDHAPRRFVACQAAIAQPVSIQRVEPSGVPSRYRSLLTRASSSRPPVLATSAAAWITQARSTSETVRSAKPPGPPSIRRLAGARAEPPAQQVGELVARGARGSGDVAEFLGELELPDRAFGETDVHVAFRESDAIAGRELDDRISLVPGDLADDRRHRGRTERAWHPTAGKTARYTRRPWKSSGTYSRTSTVERWPAASGPR